MSDSRKTITETREFTKALREAHGFDRAALRTNKTGKRAGKARRAAFTASKTKKV